MSIGIKGSGEEYIMFEEKRLEFQAILDNKDWGLVEEFYIEMENEGLGKFVSDISEMMSDEDVIEYKDWDRKINGSIETQMDDAS